MWCDVTRSDGEITLWVRSWQFIRANTQRNATLIHRVHRGRRAAPNARKLTRPSRSLTSSRELSGSFAARRRAV